MSQMDFLGKTLFFFIFFVRFNKEIFFNRSTVDSQVRSRVTVPFRIYTADKPNEKLEKEFIEEAEKNHCLRELKGHRRFYYPISIRDLNKIGHFLKIISSFNKVSAVSELLYLTQSAMKKWKHWPISCEIFMLNMLIQARKA